MAEEASGREVGLSGLTKHVDWRINLAHLGKDISVNLLSNA